MITALLVLKGCEAVGWTFVDILRVRRTVKLSVDLTVEFASMVGIYNVHCTDQKQKQNCKD